MKKMFLLTNFCLLLCYTSVIGQIKLKKDITDKIVAQAKERQKEREKMLENKTINKVEPEKIALKSNSNKNLEGQMKILEMQVKNLNIKEVSFDDLSNLNTEQLKKQLKLIDLKEKIIAIKEKIEN